MKVGLYARVSRHDKDQNPENQIIKLREFVERHGWKIHDTYIDFASGAKTTRIGFDQMLRDARARRFDAILVVRIDRLARSTRQLLNLLDDMRQKGVELICTDQQIDTTTSAGKLLFTVLGAVSELELDLIRERTKDGLVRARAEGKKLGRPPSTAKTDQIMKLRAEGLSLREIGKVVGLSHQAVKQRLRRNRVQKRSEKLD
ncbi:MAG TPA: recombinase family protein [Methanomassiliicoccales archaeon]